MKTGNDNLLCRIKYYKLSNLSSKKEDICKKVNKTNFVLARIYSQKSIGLDYEECCHNMNTTYS